MNLHKVFVRAHDRRLRKSLLGRDDLTRNWLNLTTYVLLILVILHGHGVAHAHTGGKMQLAAAEAGNFMLTVWTSPDPANVEDEIHVATAVILARDASPVLDADVAVQMTPNSGGQPISAKALTEDSENRFLYEAVIDLQESGDYTVAVKVVGSDGSTGEASFNLEVEGSSDSNLLLIGLALMVLIGASAVILLLRRTNDRDQMESSITA